MFQVKRIAWTLVSLGSWAVLTGPSLAQENDADNDVATVTVTGSLIPQSQMETAVPVTVISAEDMQVRGFTSVADAIQQAAFSTGSVQGQQFVYGFTPGVKTLSLFGLSPSYVKYLIDGRPMVDYPALYNGTDIITSISGIPLELVDHIDILPGGQSSIYGSDAIAGVVNIIMRKKLDGGVVDASYQTFQDGGGRDRRVTAANSFEFGRVNLLTGLELGKIDPIWGYQRDLTKQYFTEGTTEQVAERDYLVLSNGFIHTDPNGNPLPVYLFLDPNNCADVKQGFNNTVRRQTRPGRGDYCGTRSAGFYSLANGAEQINGYLRGTLNVNDGLTLYSDILASR